jgi:hypothetical protein
MDPPQLHHVPRSRIEHAAAEVVTVVPAKAHRR